MNSYNVTFVFDYATLTTTVMAMHEDACPDLAAWQVRDDLGIGSEVLDRAQDIIVELLDENVGMDDPVLTYEIGFVNTGDGNGWWLVNDAAGESHGGRFPTHEEAEEYAEGHIEMFERIQAEVTA